MEGATEGDHAVTAGIAAGNLHRVLYRFCTGREESRFSRAFHRNTLVNTFRQRDITFVRDDLESRMREFIQLCFDRRHDFRMAVPGIQYRDATSKINNFTSFSIPECGILGFAGIPVTHDSIATWQRILLALI